MQVGFVYCIAINFGKNWQPSKFAHVCLNMYYFHPHLCEAIIKAEARGGVLTEQSLVLDAEGYRFSLVWFNISLTPRQMTYCTISYLANYFI